MNNSGAARRDLTDRAGSIRRIPSALICIQEVCSFLSGMGLQAFVEAFFFLAARRFKSVAPREQAAALLELCEAQLEAQAGSEDRRSLSCSRAQTRVNKNQTSGGANPQQFESPAPLRRAASQDYRLHQRLRPRPLRANVEN